MIVESRLLAKVSIYFSVGDGVCLTCMNHYLSLGSLSLAPFFSLSLYDSYILATAITFYFGDGLLVIDV